MKATRIIPASIGLIVTLILVAALISMSGVPATATSVEGTLVSTPVDTAPVLDGIADEAAWAAAYATNATVSGGWYGTGTVSMKSVYKDGTVYFLYQYSDPENSNRRGPWQKQPDGSWLKIAATQWPAPVCPPGDASCEQYWSMKDPNGAYEDKFAVLWNINTPGFETAGCGITCHWGIDRANGKYGRKYTNAPGELVDMWHFKSVRTGPVGQTDDQYIDNATTGKDWGRHGDPNLGGGYSDNLDSNGDGKPDYTSPTQPAPPYYLLKSEETAMVDTYAAGDEVAAIRIAALTGDRSNLPTGSNYDETTNTWTLEIARPLVTMGNDGVTPSTKDVQFTDLDSEYLFGVAVFDNAQVEHSMSGLYKLTFAECDSPSLGLSKSGVYWASYADYTARLLSVDLGIGNSGAGAATSAQIEGAINTNGVTVVSSMPMALGGIAAGSSVAATVKYDVPAGVSSFKTTIYATATDACGNAYSYPGPMPS
ncbi:MAG: hypothetical protein C4534_09880 [Gaiellales bacterium]|nr:MAG: hypothetical protein C4534_09880 [Gaiellales bacterium]